jgi:hypothetical protein
MKPEQMPYLGDEGKAPEDSQLPQRDSLPPKSQTLGDFMRKRHQKYANLARVNAFVYYATRLTAGGCAALLPFTVGSRPQLSTVLAISVALTIVVDSVFKPRERWQLYSKATDLLALEELKLQGKYEEYKSMLDIFFATESAKLERLVDVKELVDQVNKASGALT